MSEYKRMTKQSGWKADMDLTQEMGYSWIYQRLSELENDLESGKIVRLPCKVGDKLYRVIKVFGKYQIQALNVDVLHIEARNIWFINCSSERETLYSFSEKQIGVDVFLTREEAEKRLKELQNG